MSHGENTMLSQDYSTETQVDREIMITRIFDAPRELMFQAWTEAKHLEQWWGPKGFTTYVPELNLCPGGQWRYVMIGPDATLYPMEGIFHEIVPAERLVTSDKFDEGIDRLVNAHLPKGLLSTVLFEDVGGKTELTLRILHQCTDDRLRHEAMGVVAGWNSSFDCLDEYLATF
jgi:uncharacterized protein YndB with AHSA1/START domain